MDGPASVSPVGNKGRRGYSGAGFRWRPVCRAIVRSRSLGLSHPQGPWNRRSRRRPCVALAVEQPRPECANGMITWRSPGNGREPRVYRPFSWTGFCGSGPRVTLLDGSAAARPPVDEDVVLRGDKFPNRKRPRFPWDGLCAAARANSLALERGQDSAKAGAPARNNGQAQQS